MTSSLEAVLVIVILANTILDLSFTIVLLGVLVHIFQTDKEHKASLVDGLARCRELTEMVQKVYNSMF